MAISAERKSEAINLRMLPSTEELRCLVAEREHRTLSNMLEVLILAHAERLRVKPQPAKTGEGAKRAKPRSL